MVVAAVPMLALLLVLSWPNVGALNNGLVQTPPMGYNTYMGHTDIMTIAKFFVSSGFKHSGYEFVNSDEGWEEKERDNSTGKIVPSPKFGGGAAGIKKLVSQIHDMGLKIGLYGAASGVTCGNMPGQLYHEDIDAETYADWGIDYLKSDNCASYALDSSVRFGAMRDALNRTGKPIVLSIEPFSINPDPEQSIKVANLWRIACDIQSNWDNIVNRADISDKWAPLAGPGGLINVKNPPGLSLGENRVYFGLWSLMKSPLLLSSDLPSLTPELLNIINNTEVIAINQDEAGVQARKLVVDGHRLPWLVGLAPCDAAPKTFYSRNYKCATTSDSSGDSGRCSKFSRGSTDTREWSIVPVPTTEELTNAGTNMFAVKSLSTGRCLTVDASAPSPDQYAAGHALSVNASRVVLLPCNKTSQAQLWGFGKGLHSPSSMFAAIAPDMALAIGNDTLFSASYGKDAHMVPSAAYGDTTLTFSPRADQENCTSRNCQNYDNKQMWYYDPTEQLLRATTYVASINHKNDGRGYTLTDKVPTFQHHCLAHVLSTQNEGTQTGTTEVWGGPLANGDFVMAALNRGTSSASIAISWDMLEVASVTTADVFDVRDLWAKKQLHKAQAAGFTASVGPHDIQIFRLSKPSY